jgi:hypothetical protein
MVVPQLRKGTVRDKGANKKTMDWYKILRNKKMIKRMNHHRTLHLKKMDLINQNRPFQLVMMFRSPTLTSMTLYNNSSLWKLSWKNKMINQMIRMKNFKNSCLSRSKEALGKYLSTSIHISRTSHRMTWIKMSKHYMVFENRLINTK